VLHPGKKKIHMIAICGTGMAALAGLLKRSGHVVTGSDQNIYPPMSDLLAELAITCFQGFRAEQIPAGTDLVVIGNAVGKNNPEALAVLNRGVPYLSMPQALSQFFLQDKDPVVVVGTHGKTTTTALLAWSLESSGADPGLMVGGWATNFKGSHKLGAGSLFVVEGDEYDSAFFDKGPKFLHYRPKYAILTSVEFDHGDIYPDIDAVKSAFSRFTRLLPPEGLLMAAPEEGAVAQVVGGIAAPVQTYGLGEGVDWLARSICFESNLTRFEVLYRGRSLGFFESPLMGRHNVKNTLGVLGLLWNLGLSKEKIQEGLLGFAGIKRRQEIVGVVNDIIVMDDFAHHPTALCATVEAVKSRYPNRRIWAIFEPRSATSRRNIFQAEFVEALQGADRAVLVNPFAVESIAPESRLDSEKIVAELRRRGREADYFPSADAVVTQISPRLAPGDLVLVMSSGGFDGIHKKLLTALAREPVS